jgi:hypothetical protein
VPQRYPPSTQPTNDDELDDLKEDKLVVPVTRKLKRRAHNKAQQQGRSLAAIIRAWVMGWADDEFPDPPNISAGVKAAPKRTRKRTEAEKSKAK